MTIQELHEHFLSRAPWVDRGGTPDLIEHGDPQQAVTKIGVGWSACAANLEAAARDGCDLYITHEPSFCDFWKPDAALRETAWGRRRMQILEAHGMGLFALHDTWDVWPRYGVHDAWAQTLGLADALATEAPRPRLRISLFGVDPVPLDAFARRVAAAVVPFGQDGVIVHGDADRPVSRVAIGTGCCLPAWSMLDRGADLLIHVMDGSQQTTMRLPLLDAGARLIEVEHSVAEMPGMQRLATYINAMFPALSATFYRHESPTRIVS